MTYEEAIKELEQIPSHIGADCDGYEKRAISISIKALEKQIPKKVKKYNLKFYTCPNCGNGYGGFFDMLHFCWNCGQAIDWSDAK